MLSAAFEKLPASAVFINISIVLLMDYYL